MHIHIYAFINMHERIYLYIYPQTRTPHPNPKSHTRRWKKWSRWWRSRAALARWKTLKTKTRSLVRTSFLRLDVCIDSALLFITRKP